MTFKRASRYPPELRERAVRTLLEQRSEYRSEYVLPTVQNWVFRNLGGTFQARGLITRRLSNSNPARPYICRFSIFRRFT